MRRLPLEAIVFSLTLGQLLRWDYFKLMSLFGVLWLPCGPVVKNLPANAGDVGSVPGSGRSPGGDNGNTLQ